MGYAYSLGPVTLTDSDGNAVKMVVAERNMVPTRDVELRRAIEALSEAVAAQSSEHREGTHP